MRYSEYVDQMERLRERAAYLRQVEEALKKAAEPVQEHEDDEVYEAIEAAQALCWSHQADVEQAMDDLDNEYERETA